MYNENNRGPRTVPWGTSDKMAPVWFNSIHHHTLLSVTEKRIYLFQSSHQCHLSSSWGCVSKAFSKSKMEVSTSPPLSKILAKSYITVINWVSQHCFFRNDCCLSDKSLCSSKCAIIFEQRICSSNLHGTQVREGPCPTIPHLNGLKLQGRCKCEWTDGRTVGGPAGKSDIYIATCLSSCDKNETLNPKIIISMYFIRSKWIFITLILVVLHIRPLFKEWSSFFWGLSNCKLHWVACRVILGSRNLFWRPNVVYSSINIRKK